MRLRPHAAAGSSAPLGPVQARAPDPACTPKGEGERRRFSPLVKRRYWTKISWRAQAALPADLVERLPIPWEAAFLAGKCFVKYRRRGGSRRSALPDFFIGAHAAVEKLPLITRDPARYRTYFPTVQVIAPS